jgi:hypothetical protein
MKRQRKYVETRTIFHDNVEKIILVYGEMTERKTRENSVKTLNMGWSICQTNYDEFDTEKGINLAKKRFEKPLVTENGKFLTSDMVLAILKNELDYIENHIDKYLNYFKD